MYEQTTKNDPHQLGADVIICFSSLVFTYMFKSAPPGPGIHAYLWLTYQELGGGGGVQPQPWLPRMPGTTGPATTLAAEGAWNPRFALPIKSVRLTVDWKRSTSILTLRPGDEIDFL